jgi:sugar-specific transcriptional regulator TrmB
LSEAITRQLLDFGLTDKEANIYLALLRNGKARAGEIARKLQLNRMIVYRVLTKLQERELVKATMEKPMKFIPIPLEKALELLIRETETKLSLMRDRYDAVVDGWRGVISEPPTSDVLSFKIVQGRKQIYDLLAKMFKSASNWIRLVTTKKDLVRFQYVDLDDALKRAAKRGVKVQIVIQYEDDKLDIVRHYASFASVKVVPISKATRLFIADDKEMIITFTTDDSMVLNTKQETCLKIESTEGKSLDTVVDIFTNFWESADELDILESMSNKTGEDLKTLKTEEGFNKALEGMVETAESELLIGIPKDAPPSMKEKIMSEASKRAGQLYVRMILFLELDDIERSHLLEKVDAYHSDLLQSMQFVIKDRKEILVTLRLNPSEGGARTKHVWSNSRLYVESMAELLEGLWTRSEGIEVRMSELKRNQMAAECIAELKSILERSNWKVQVPGIISPTSEVQFEFGLLAEDAEGRRLVAEFVNGGSSRSLELITSFYGKAMNAGVDSLCLLSVPPLSLQEASFAEYCNMHVVTAESIGELPAKLIELGKQTTRQYESPVLS